ncbi:hypothetical protein QE152_g33489 [Popillia japonica]|uniref:Uncharacterized protein n=1 Tax=Popillia japonica TaxID=7064 RepID=A0AAW1IWQ7_POPJA
MTHCKRITGHKKKPRAAELRGAEEGDGGTTERYYVYTVTLNGRTKIVIHDLYLSEPAFDCKIYLINLFIFVGRVAGICPNTMDRFYRSESNEFCMLSERGHLSHLHGGYAA